MHKFNNQIIVLNYSGHLEKPLPSNLQVPHLFILSLRYQSYMYLFFYSSHICQLSNSTQEVFSLPFPPPFPFLPSSIIVLFKLSLHLLSLFIPPRKSVKTHLLKYLCNVMSLSLLLQRTRNKCFGTTFDKVEKSVSHARINTTHHTYANEHGSGVFKKLFFNSQIDLSFTSANSQILTVCYRDISDEVQKDLRFADENKGMLCILKLACFKDTWAVHICVWWDGLCWLWQVDPRFLWAVEDIEQLIKKWFDCCWTVAILTLLSLKRTICGVY